MLQLSVAMFTCAVAFAASTSFAPAADGDGLAAPREQPMTRESCIAAGAVDRARCQVQAKAKAAGKDSDGQCEEAMNLQQRMCMLDVLERLHPGATRPR
jgi:hypothetical protein